MGSLWNTVVFRNECSGKLSSIDTCNVIIQSDMIYLEGLELILLTDK